MYIHQEESKSNRRISQRGSTLVEVLVTIVILTVAITPAIYLSNLALNIGTSIRDNLVASFLSQEGVEIVRAIRDANWFSGLAFNAGLADGVYQVEWDDTSLTPDANAFLKIDATGRYNYLAGTTTLFKRKITITNISASQIEIQSTVTWAERGRAKSLVIESRLFNWR